MNPSFIAKCCLVLLACDCTLGVATAQTIQWRVSVKFILDAAGNRPPNTYINQNNGKTITNAISTDTQVQSYFDYGNWVLARYGRGYRMSLTEITNVAGQSAWFNIDAAVDGNDQDTVSDPSELKTAVLNSFNSGANAFLYDPAAINVFIVNGNTAGSCSCGISSPQDGDLIVLSQNINPDWVVLHESGHFLGLPHTHDGEKNLNSDGSVCTNKCSCAVLLPGDDNIADTLPDHDCWDTADQIATNNFNGRLFASLTASEQQLVSNTLSNIMSYHGNSAAPRDPVTGGITGPADRSILTADQMDLVTDRSNSSRANVAGGKTWFVDHTNTSAAPLGDSHALNLPVIGLVGGPFLIVKDGIVRAGAQDIVLIRPGSYTDTTRFDKAMTLRATRGNATLRAP